MKYIKIISILFFILWFFIILLYLTGLYLFAFILLIIYFIFIIKKPNILLAWKIDKRWFLKLLPVSLVITVFLINLIIANFIGNIWLQSEPVIGCLSIVSIMGWLSFFDYAEKLNDYNIDQYMYEIDKYKYNNELTNMYITAFIVYIKDFMPLIFKINYHFWLQFFRVIFVILIIIAETLNTFEPYSDYFKMFDKGVVISLAVEKMFEINCKKIEDKRNELNAKYSGTLYRK